MNQPSNTLTEKCTSVYLILAGEVCRRVSERCEQHRNETGKKLPKKMAIEFLILGK